MTAPRFLTVKELAALLRVTERKVYDLAATGAVPCSRATGKLLFPEAEIHSWIGGGAPRSRPPVVLGSHDPLLDWALRESGAGLATLFDGSGDGLDRFRRSEGVAAGLHVRVDGEWNVPLVRDVADAVLLGFAVRSRGLVCAPGAGIAGLPDLTGRRVARRQPGAGSETLFSALLDGAGAAPDTAIVARSEQDAVLAVAHGTVEACFGLEAVAAPYGLDFVPVLDERFDLLVDRRAAFEPPLQTFLSFCRSAAFADQAATLAGYDVSETGRVRWNA